MRCSLLALTFSALVGCTTMQSVTSTELDATIAALEPGDRVSVLTRTGWHERLLVVAVTDTQLRLETYEDAPVDIARADVWELQVPVPSKHKRGALAGAIVGAVVLGTLISDGGWELDF